MWPAYTRRDRHPSGGQAAALRPSGRRWHQKQRQSRSGRGARHAAAANATDGGRSSPPITEGRSGSLPTRRQAPTRRTLLLSTDDERLEAEDRGRPQPGSLFPTMRPAVIILGDRRQGTAAGCVMKILEAERWLKGANPREIALLQQQQEEGNTDAPHLGARKVEGCNA
jgi:hypothetical protein